MGYFIARLQKCNVNKIILHSYYYYYYLVYSTSDKEMGADD